MPFFVRHFVPFQGSNFDDEEEKTTGGRNGYGAKLANIFSRKFTVECVDATQGLKFTQTWRNNMHEAEDPVVESCSSSKERNGDYVKITFRLDLAKFNMAELDDDAVALISKREYDISGSMASREGRRLNVYLNGEKLKVKDFRSYLSLFDGISFPEIYERVGEDWEVGVGSVMDVSAECITFDMHNIMSAHPNIHTYARANHSSNVIIREEASSKYPS